MRAWRTIESRTTPLTFQTSMAGECGMSEPMQGGLKAVTAGYSRRRNRLVWQEGVTAGIARGVRALILQGWGRCTPDISEI